MLSVKGSREMIRVSAAWSQGVKVDCNSKTGTLPLGRGGNLGTLHRPRGNGNK